LSISRFWLAIILLAFLPALLFAASAPAVKNPGFEKALDGWHALPETPGASVAAVKVRSRSGKLSLELKADGGQNPWVAQGLPDIVPHATYLLSAYEQHGEGGGQAAIKLEFYDAANKFLGGFYGLEPAQSTGDWTELSVRAEAPENAAKAAVILRLIGPGSVYFDDVAFALVAQPPPLVLTPARVTAPAQKESKVELTAELAPTVQVSGEPAAAVVGLGQRPQKVTLTSSAGAGTGRLNLEITVPALAPGFYRLQVQWPKLTPAVVDLLVLPSGQRPAGIDDKGRFVQAGQVVVPVGIYHATPEQFPALAAAGFNVVEIAPPMSADELRPIITAAQGAKLRLLVPLYPGLQSLQMAQGAGRMVKEFAGQTTIFGWLLADQPEARPEMIAPVTELYISVREADGNHPALITCGPQADLAKWAPLCDGLLVDAFPRAGAPEALAARLDRAGDGVRPSQPWTAVLAAGWPGQDPPSTDQARTWLYRAIVDGSAGAAWFSLHEDTWDLTTTPLWKDFPKLNAEAAELGQAWAEGQPLAGTEISVKGVTAHAVQLGGQIYLVLLNDTGAAVQGAARLPVVVTRGDYLDGSGAAEVDSHTVKFDLPAGAVRVIRLSLPGAVTAPAAPPAMPAAPPAAPAPAASAAPATPAAPAKAGA
jgi:hypothetical protein